MIGEARSVKSRIKTCSFLQQIISSHIEVFKDCESDMVVGIRIIVNTTPATAESKVIELQIAGSVIFTPQVQAKKIRSMSHCIDARMMLILGHSYDANASTFV
jgi:hypothetical protein